MHRPGTRDFPTRPRSPSRAAPRDQDSRARCRHTHVHHTKEGLRNPHSVTRNSALPSPPAIFSVWAGSQPTPEETKILGHTGVRAHASTRPAAINFDGALDWAQTTMTTSPKSATTASGPKGGRRTIIVGHSLHHLVLGTRLSPLLAGLGPPSARPRPGPDGSCPRRTNSARTTSRPVTRISRGTGDSPPSLYHVLGTRRTQLSTRTIPSPDTAGPTGKSGDSDTTTKPRCPNDWPTGPWK
jgi:hypothetical protein